MWTISYDPGCFSRWRIVPTRPTLEPPVIRHILPGKISIQVIMKIFSKHRIIFSEILRVRTS